MDAANKQKDKPRVLLVDDEVNILRALKRVLHRDGYAVDLAEGGAEGIRKLEESEYAVIICDQKMPDVSGADVLAKSCQIRPDTYRITLTGYTDLESAQRSINEGNIHRFLTKPWDESTLREVVKQGAAAYELVQENRRLSALAEERRVELEKWNQELEAKVAERTQAVEARNRALAALRDQVESSLRDTVLLLVNLLDAADPDAASHSRRVAELSVQIAQKLDLDADAIRSIEFAALLHEIGRLANLHEQKRGGPSHKKPKKRAPIHEIAHAMLGQVHGFEKIAEAIRCVPAQYAGGGKFSVKEASIPLTSRIIAAADVFDRAAVDSKKSTEPCPDAGRKAVRAVSGSMLDPQIVQILDSDEEEAPTIAVHEIELSPTRLRPGMRLARDLINTLSHLLLAEGTELNETLIKRIRHLASEQMLPRGVFVCCEDQDADEIQAEDDNPALEPGRDVA
ncbi:MAG: response regulator [Phycisphaeraceae bacterium]|nr:response regulator [Phycisphaeraceae bacterium]